MAGFADQFGERRKPSGAVPRTIPYFSVGLSLRMRSIICGIIEIALPVRNHAGRCAGKLDELADFRVPVRRQCRDRNAPIF